MARDALGADARDELGIAPTSSAQPVQAAMYSAGSFAVGAALPLAAAALAPAQAQIAWVSASSLVFLALLAALAARAGGAEVLPGAWRVTFWGFMAMAMAMAAAALFGSVA